MSSSNAGQRILNKLREWVSAVLEHALRPAPVLVPIKVAAGRRQRRITRR